MLIKILVELSDFPSLTHSGCALLKVNLAEIFLPSLLSAILWIVNESPAFGFTISAKTPSLSASNPARLPLTVESECKPI